ncbi:MAG: 16S rRNA (adenine(1518)-N(6)/adenine(1519)-N(6))-dimethyltransferase RsmA [Myxococcota bacterium]
MHPAARLRELEQRARRRFGQNFLVNPGVCERIVAAATLRPGEHVLEIGPGLGVLTSALLDVGARVTCVELDRDLAAALRESHPSVTLIEGDALKVDLPAADAVVANLPYNVATPLLMKLLAARYPRMVLMFQREVADRLEAGVDDDAYGALSVQVAARARVERVLTLPPGAFHPPPKVHSAVLRFDPFPSPDLPEGFDRTVRLGFSLRRKKLINALASDLDKERALAALAAAGIDPGVRAETVDLAGWRRLAEALA